MGGGKGAIDHYVTPIKSGRVIIEVGGPVEYAEVIFFGKIKNSPNRRENLLIYY